MTEIFSYKSTRDRPFYCPKCGLNMEVIDEEADSDYIIIGKRFKCTQCDYTLVKIYKNTETYEEEPISIEILDEERELFV